MAFFIILAMEIKQLVVGPFQTNCYIVEKEGHCLIIDPGSNPKRIIEHVGEAIVDGICLTHGHFDHIQAVDALVKHYHCDVFISEDDECMLGNIQYNGSYMVKEFVVKTKPKHYPNHTCRIGKFELEPIEASGHTNGSVMLAIENHLFCGDVLFKESIGRTDLPWSSQSRMVNTLNMIKTMTQDYLLYPGHGETSTLYEEFKNNPYLQ